MCRQVSGDAVTATHLERRGRRSHDLIRTRHSAEPTEIRVQRSCGHPLARHVHGTRTAYVRDRCRCGDCTTANTVAAATRVRAQAYGQWHPFTDARPVRDHLRGLRAAGLGVTRIAALAATSPSHIRGLADPGDDHHPPVRRVRPDTADRILRIEAHPAPGARIDGTGTHRRVQALIATGWPVSTLAAQLGRTTSSLTRTMTAPTVTAGTAAAIRDLYDRAWSTPPPHTTEQAAARAARTYRARRGWHPPLAWDDIDLDAGPRRTDLPRDPVDIDEIAVERALAGDGVQLRHLTPSERRVVIHYLTTRGQSLRDIADRLATTPRTIARHRARMIARTEYDATTDSTLGSMRARPAGHDTSAGPSPAGTGRPAARGGRTPA